jgi:hypothetical protein
MNLTVTEQAIIDLQKQKEAFTARSRNFDPSTIRGPDTLLTVDYVDALTRPVRLEISFEDPIKTRQQIEALQAALMEALVVTQDHGRGINRQRMDLRNIIEQAAKVLVLMHGRRPDRRDRRRNRTT